MLESIDLSRCNQISVVGIAALVSCKKLRDLSLRNCTKISAESLSGLFLNSRVWNSIVLGGCTKFAALYGFAGLDTVRILDLESCQIIDQEFQLLLDTSFKHTLESLSIAGCKQISSACFCDVLLSLRSLRFFSNLSLITLV